VDQLVLPHPAGDYGKHRHGFSGFRNEEISRYSMDLDFPENEKGLKACSIVTHFFKFVCGISSRCFVERGNQSALLIKSFGNYY
jgi:hypothetical protein